MQSTGKAVTGYHSMRFTDGAAWWHYRGGARYALGTSLCFRRDWWADHPFPALQVGEDGGFAEAAADQGQLATVDAGDRMFATVHNRNTKPTGYLRQSLGTRWSPDEKVVN
jgi:hypothetical protein